MKYNLKQYEREWIGEKMISVNENSLYISSKVRKMMNLASGVLLTLFLDNKKLVIGIKVTQEQIGHTTKINSRGYCKLRLSMIDRGRYFYQETKDGLFIFKHN